MSLAKFHAWRLPAIAAAAMLPVLSAVSFAAEIDVADILKCQAMQDDASRLACYDSLNSPRTPEKEPPASDPVSVEPAPVAPAQKDPVATGSPPGEAPAEPPAAELPPTAPTAAVGAEASAETSAVVEESAVNQPVPLDDEIGRESLRGDARKEQPVVRGTVVSCREELTGKYLFYFDNGQIWRQKDNTQIRWKECAFDVTISKDVFGYRMVPDGQKKRVRIARVK